MDVRARRLRLLPSLPIWSAFNPPPRLNALPLNEHTLDLETRLAAFKSQPKSTSSDELQALAVELAKLSKTLTDATGSLPSYDQRQCELVCPIALHSQ